MNYLFYAAPVASDAEFAQKQVILNDLAGKRNMSVYFAIDRFYQKPVDEILDGIRKASVVIVDLSFERPSVYFELGLMAATGRKLEAIAALQTRIHQVPSTLVIRYYDNLASYSQVLESILDENVLGFSA